MRWLLIDLRSNLFQLPFGMRRQRAARRSRRSWSWSHWRNRPGSRRPRMSTICRRARASIAATDAAAPRWSRASRRRRRRCSCACGRWSALGRAASGAMRLSMWNSIWHANAIAASRPRTAMRIRSTARISAAASARTQMRATSAWSNRITSIGTTPTAPAPAATIRVALPAPSSTRPNANAPMWVTTATCCPVRLDSIGPNC